MIFRATHYIGAILNCRYDVTNSGHAGWYVERLLTLTNTREVATKDGSWQRLLNTSNTDYLYFHNEQAAFDFIEHGTMPQKSLVDLYPSL